jgi:HAD superfamily hydrolase (TIGR01509 family)
MPSAILFDYDDTLVQTRQCKYRALQALATRNYQLELSDAELDRHWGVAYAELFRRLFGAVEPDLRRAIAAYEALDSEFEMTAYPETLRVLEALQARHCVGVVTAAGRSLVEGQMRKLGFPVDAFALLQTAEDTPHHKPDPRVFEPALRILADLGISPRSTLYVGDSIRDFHAARDAGLAFVGVLRGTTSQQEFAEAGVTAVESLDGLLD